MDKDKLKPVNHISKIAALANAESYNAELTKRYIQGAPHLKHRSLRNFYARLAAEVCAYAKKFKEIPRVLDLGAGEGAATLEFLGRGVEVTAVDISKSQLASLENKCKLLSNRLTVYSQDVEEFLSFQKDDSYDIVVVSSFLHHLPDYLGLIRKIMNLVAPHGQFFSFQDPLRYDSVNRFTRAFSEFSYFSWRIFQGDVVGGVKRKMRRARGIYLPDCKNDFVEYHVARNGVDQDGIMKLFAQENFDIRVIPYFSTQSPVFQSLGDLLKLKNTFAVIARR